VLDVTWRTASLGVSYLPFTGDVPIINSEWREFVPRKKTERNLPLYKNMLLKRRQHYWTKRTKWYWRKN